MYVEELNPRIFQSREMDMVKFSMAAIAMVGLQSLILREQLCLLQPISGAMCSISFILLKRTMPTTFLYTDKRALRIQRLW